jgi:hypothetical protein
MRCVAFLKNYIEKSEQELPILVPLEDVGMEGTRETVSRVGTKEVGNHWVVL